MDVGIICLGQSVINEEIEIPLVEMSCALIALVEMKLKEFYSLGAN